MKTINSDKKQNKFPPIQESNSLLCDRVWRNLDNSHILQGKVFNPSEQRSIEDLIFGDILTHNERNNILMEQKKNLIVKLSMQDQK